MKKSSPALGEEALELVARRFSILGEPMRLRLLQCLQGGELHVGALVEASGGTQTNVSRHLQVLTEAGLLQRRKEGLQVFYAVADPSIYQLCELVCGSLARQHRDKASALSRT